MAEYSLDASLRRFRRPHFDHCLLHGPRLEVLRTEEV
jgi:hypothetical protein